MNRENSRDSSKEKLSLERLPSTDEQFLTTDYFQKAKFQAARQYISKKIDEQAKKETSHRQALKTELVMFTKNKSFALENYYLVPF